MTPSEAVASALGAVRPRPKCMGIAVSGGSDSLCLLYLAADWARDAGVEICAATVDHGLRPEAADEARMVSQACAGLGVSHTTLTWKHGEIGGNLQDQARRARYGLISAWAEGNNIKTVLLGHTRDDQAETFLLRLARGSGVDGLSGMPAQRTQGGVTWLRPILDCRRADLREVLSQRGVRWIEDPSNDDERYDRVRARKMLEVLAPLGLNVERLAETAERMSTAREALEVETRRQAAKIAQVDSGDVTLSVPGLLEVPDEIRHRLLAHSFRWVAAADYGPRSKVLRDLWQDIRNGGISTLHGCIAEVRNEALLITREWKSVAGHVVLPGELWDNRWRLTGPEMPGATVRALGEDGLKLCNKWRETGRARRSLLASPSVWLEELLVSAPLAGLSNGWSAIAARCDSDFLDTILSH